MATSDIKDLGIFNTQHGMDKVKAYHNKNQSNKKDNTNKSIISSNQLTTHNPKGAGAPIRKFDRVYTTKSPLKLSALLNSISRNLVEKYETELTRDELLRKALNEYIKQNLPIEDKQELYTAVSKDLALFREKYPTISEKDSQNNIIRSSIEIEQETSDSLKKAWGISKRN